MQDQGKHNKMYNQLLRGTNWLFHGTTRKHFWTEKVLTIKICFSKKLLHKSLTPDRCNETTEFEVYASLNHKIFEANETEILKLTGCLSNCDTYDYAIRPLTNLRIMKTKTFHKTFKLKFVIPYGRHEVKEQVETGQ